MSDNLHPAIVKSHEVFDTVWKTLPPEQKEAIKGLVQAIGELGSQVSQFENIDDSDPPRFSEPRYVAFTSQHGSLVFPTENGAGIVWELTTRADTIEETLSQMVMAQKTAIGIGFIPADKYVDQRRADRGATSQVVTSQPGQPTDTNGHPSTPAQSIVAAPMSDKKPDLIWKIRTGKSKFPVPIYEAIEGVKPALMSEGVDLSTFVTHEGKLREYQLSGWLALYEQNEKGYPSKVVQLVKAG